MNRSHRKSDSGVVADRSTAFQELKAESKELWDLLAQLRELCSRPISLRHECLSFVQKLSDLRDQLAMTFAEEEACDAVFQSAHVTNNLAQRAADLRAEHKSLYLEINELVEHAETLLARHQPATIAIQIPDQFDAFFHKLEQHEWNERELIYMTLEIDEGDGD